MSTAFNDGGPAFARTGSADIHGYGIPDQEGMSLRDYFAAKAMMAIIIANGADYSGVSIGAAEDAYTMADNMITVRGKP